MLEGTRHGGNVGHMKCEISRWAMIGDYVEREMMLSEYISVVGNMSSMT